MDWDRLLVGLAGGAAAGLLELVIAAPAGSGVGRRALLPGSALAPAVLLGLLLTRGSLPFGLVAGAALLALAAESGRRWPGGSTATRLPRWAWAAGLPGAAAIASAAPAGSRMWIPVGVAIALTCLVPAACELTRDRRDQLLPAAYLALAGIGLLLAVPDTEEAQVVAAALGSFCWVTWMAGARPIGAPGLAATLAVFVWVAATGGRGREGSVIGGVGCLGLLIIEPLVRSLLARGAVASGEARGPGRRRVLLLTQAAVVMLSARWAGALRSAAAAAAVCTAVLAVAAVVVAFARRGWRQAGPGVTSGPGLRAP